VTYDGTIAANGRVDAQIVAALERLRASGRKLLLVTGRQLDDLCHVFAHMTLFEVIVAENGAVPFTGRPHAKSTPWESGRQRHS
jgi:hydroxymethylpyrimidine pyrophosphatase-like HAD family hydrolase